MHLQYSAQEITKLLGLPAAAVRRCLRAALLPPPSRNQHYSFQDLILLKTCRGLIEAAITTKQIRRLLESLKNQLPHDQHLSTLRIYASGRRVIVWDGTAHWQPDCGQFLFNFDAQEFPGLIRQPAHLRARKVRSACEWVVRGEQLEDTSDEEARQAYHEALRIEPEYAPAHLRLGKLYFNCQDWPESKRCFYHATRYDQRDAQGPYYLAIVLERLGQADAAVKAFKQALLRDARFYDAHVQLARLYEAQGKKPDAIRHYHAARRLQDHR
ncbi:MAG: tetratricopeptide repeat protein [Nitrospiraceae bacterium]